ncbi:hypothetical protein HPB49_001969 [Dermacentor silvarum]|uniref:Uncharacterized protein n=2 Tax=Dermacentor silvarum TaxID=543639 RepID=A0ACB8D253_DERSI|nr:uncharacterized protein LOC119445232 isoform X1 [Dermacentor silvarum]KAH7958464.1 hypothetical protein HPB49_001969 [Dermacentor silvarum]
MAALLLLFPSLLLAVAPAAGQLRRMEIIPDPPPFVPEAPPMLMNMVDMMERVMNELVPQPIMPMVAGPVPGPMVPGPMVSGPIVPGPMIPDPVVAGAEAASNESRNESAEAPRVDVAIDIKLVPLGVPGSPMGGIILPLPRFVQEPVSSASKREGTLRKRHNATTSSVVHVDPGHKKVAVLEVTRTNSSRPVLQPVAPSEVKRKKEHESRPSTSSPSSSAAPELPSSPKPAERVRSPAESAEQQLQGKGAQAVVGPPDSSVASSRRSPIVAKVSSAVGGVATDGTNKTDPTSSSTETGIAATCYALFLRHGLLLLVLAVICGISCLLGALLPIFCRRRRAQVSQYPPKRRFVPARIFADPQMMRMFRRREHMVA